MTNPQDSLKNEFYSKIAEFSTDGERIDPYPMQRIADWWLLKIAEKDKKLIEAVECIEVHTLWEKVGVEEDAKVVEVELVKKEDVLSLITKENEGNTTG